MKCPMDISKVDKIKTAIIIGIASDDGLMELLTLKGGNAMSMIYEITNRASYDLDYSMEADIQESMGEFKQRLEDTIASSLKDIGYHVIDFNMAEKPKNMPIERQEFWGGYHAHFKIIPAEKYDSNMDVQKLRNLAEEIGPGHLKKFPVDISKHEYTEKGEYVALEGLDVRVYTPSMLVAEKVRAICQQMPEYLEVIGKDSPKRGNRAKDFYDIHAICSKIPDIDTSSEEFYYILQKMFEVKRADIKLIKRIASMKSFYSEGFGNVKDTLPAHEQEQLQGFDVYHSFVVDIVDAIAERQGI